MIRGIAFFMAVWFAVTVLIAVFHVMSGAEKLSFVKTASYAAATAFIALSIVGLMVAIF